MFFRATGFLVNVDRGKKNKRWTLLDFCGKMAAMLINEIKISSEIWQRKYRFKQADGTPVDKTVGDSFLRVATALAKPEKAAERKKWAAKFSDIMSSYRFLPAGRILAGAGTGRAVTLFNCFVMGRAEDSIAGIFDELKHAALAMQQGGGIGQDFSTLRPLGAVVKGVGAKASGPLSFMHVWDAMCRTIMSAGSRRGAMMATLSCDHPDIEAFIEAKRQGDVLQMFNLSVLVSDAFMAAVKADDDWSLQFDGKVYKTLKSRDLWQAIMRANFDSAEPGVIFIDRVNGLNNLSYCETIYATNPCGEQPLPPFGACLLGSINLPRLVEQPFAEKAGLNEKILLETVSTAVRMLDNVIDVSVFPLAELAGEAANKRRIGLGVTGLADALAMCRLRYGSKEAVKMAGRWMALIEQAAYRASAHLAREKGAFALFDAKAYVAAPKILGLDETTRKAIAKHGVRNALVTSIAPTGTISLFAGNVSSGIEPIFAYDYSRRVLRNEGGYDVETVSDYAVRLFRDMFGDEASLPAYFVSAHELTPDEHLAMQAALQPHVDSAISKTINCAEDISFTDFCAVYEKAYDLGLKGCTTYRANSIAGAVLSENAVVPEPSVNEAHEVQAALPLEAPQAPEMPGGPVSEHAAGTGDIVYMKQPLERQKSLPGFTYKLKWPDSAHAIYITVNDIIQDGRRRPFEVFINSKNMEHYAWTVALTRMISAVFRRGGDVSFVVEELKAVFDPRGGQWMEGKYVPSLLAAIGGVIERHMIDTGFLQMETGDDKKPAAERLVVGAPGLSAGAPCPKCGESTLVFQEGCASCVSCDYSRCS